MSGLGEFIARLREEAGLSRSALARAAKIDPSILARVESGEREEVRLDTLCRLADALGVTLDDLAAAAGLRAHRRSPTLTASQELLRFKAAMTDISKIVSDALESKPTTTRSRLRRKT